MLDQPLPVIDLSPLSAEEPDSTTLASLSQSLNAALSTTGFVYLTNPPLTFTHSDIFALVDSFFTLSHSEKMTVAKRPFRASNGNTYRGYFPAQPGSDNLKEGFEIGRARTPEEEANISPPNPRAKFNLSEPNVWPATFTGRANAEKLHEEMQALSVKLLSLLALALGKLPSHFSHYIHSSLSTLRFLHYPLSSNTTGATSVVNLNQIDSRSSDLICTPHTDSGLLTLLHQDPTGGLEILHPVLKTWIAAPYIPGSIVLNIGDLMAKVSGGLWKATVHRVRKCDCMHNDHSGAVVDSRDGEPVGRLSVPFFFEPGRDCIVTYTGADDGFGKQERRGITYEEYVLGKMAGWVEFQDPKDEDEGVVGNGVEGIVEVEVTA